MTRSVRGRVRVLNPDQRRVVLAQLAGGERAEDVAAGFGVSRMTVDRVRNEAVLGRRRVDHSPHRLSFAERERISRGIAAQESSREIGRVLCRAASTISREIKLGGGREHYRAITAERISERRARRPKATKLSECPRLVTEVIAGLRKRWSPQQIEATLVIDFPEDLEMRISHETIYLSLYVQSRGELHRQLTQQLRTKRKTRKEQGRAQKRGRIVDMVNISERPAEVEDRAGPGHWEGDLILGAYGRSGVATLVERQTRFVMLAYLGTDKRTNTVIDALAVKIGELPEQLKRSLTWDQGVEMHAHKRFTIDTGVQIYFCDPHSPWQRGSNENTNGLLRDYLPKGTDLSIHDQDGLDRIAQELNERPRQTLGWRTPAQKMAELLTTAPSSDA